MATSCGQYFLIISTIIGACNGWYAATSRGRHMFVMKDYNSNSVPTTEKYRYLNAVKAFGAVGTFLMLNSVAAVDAKTFFDTDVYGDKELKIATVNKIKQRLRNAILANPSIAPSLLELAISDALGYNLQTGEGGQDGSISFEISEDTGSSLTLAIKALKNVQKELQRTTSVSFGDIVAFGGAEALETVGCGRVTVQLGRYEVKTANPDYSPVVLSDPTVTISTVKSAFQRSGLEPQRIAALLGALGEVRRVVAETAAANSAEEEADEEFEPQPFVPTTFGSRNAMYGARLGKADFGSTYLASIVKGKGPRDELSRLLLEDAQVKAFALKYATNEIAFIKDVADSYQQLTSVGQEYTSRNS